MTVGELLERTTARELSEWEAYERAVGPLGSLYHDDVLAAIQEQLQVLNRLTGAQFEDNPAPVPKSYPRPSEVLEFVERHRAGEAHAEEEPEMDREEFDRLFDE